MPWQLLWRLYGKLISGNKNIFARILTCVRGMVSEGASLWCKTKMFRVNLALQCVYGCSNETNGSGDEEGHNEILRGADKMETAW